MCLAIPGKVIELVAGNDQLARVDVSGAVRLVNIGMLDAEPQRGDWLVIHAGFALSKIDDEEARHVVASLELMGQPEDGARLLEIFAPPSVTGQSQGG